MDVRFCLPSTRRFFLSLPILMAVLLLSIGVSLAQDSRISGTVKDATGGVIPGVEVSVTNLDTGVVRETITDDSGRYSVPQLFAGNYAVTASMVGFETQRLELLLDPSQTTDQNFSLSVGAPSTVVEVSSTAARINVNPYDMATTIEAKQIEQLPLNGRNYLSLATLSPGILTGSQGGRGQVQDAAFKSGGLAMEHVAISLDGVDNTGRVVYGPLATQTQTATPPPEAVSEFKIITNNTSAEYGAKAGATILISTKGGTNQLHASAYWFHRNVAVAANNFMFNRDAPRDPDTGEITSDKPPYLRNQFGGTIGGPIIKDKTFFFFSFQGTRLREGSQSFLRNVPSPGVRKGDFSQEDNANSNRNSNIFDPLSLVGTGAAAERTEQFPGNVIPIDRQDTAAMHVVDLFPLPNVAGRDYTFSNYFNIAAARTESELYDMRVDHNFNDNHRIFGRFSYRNQDSFSRTNNNPLPWPANSAGINAFRTQQFSVNYNATLSPTIHNEFRGGYSRFPASRTDEHTENLNAKYGIPNSMPEQYPELAVDPKHQVGLVNFVLTGFQNVGNGSPGGTISGRLDTMTLADNLLWDVGNHSLKFGIEYRRWDNLRSQLVNNDMGSMNFRGDYTAQFPNQANSRSISGHTMADVVLGMPFAASSGLPIGESMLVPYWGFYAQDDWRITPRLTLNLGLRYELFLQPRIKDNAGLQNAMSVWDIKSLDEVSPTIDVSFIRWEFPKGEGDCGCIVNKNNWAPRIGIAYRLTDNTVIRAGGGIYYSENSAAGIESNRYSAGGPIGTWASWGTNNREAPPLTVSGGFPDFQINADADPLIYPYTNTQELILPLKKTITVYQWFLDIQHQLPWNILMTIGYNGTSGHNMPWWRRSYAVGIGPSVIPALDVTRRRVQGPEMTNTSLQMTNWVLTGDNVLTANFNALTWKMEKRFSQGLSFTSAFTWSKGLDFGLSSINERTEGINGGGGPQSPYTKDLWRNYGQGGLSRNFHYVMSGLYELPAGPGKGRFTSGPASWFLGGWQLGSIVTLASGPWATMMVSDDRQNTGGPYRGIMVYDPNIPSSERDSMLWYDRAGVVAGTDGEWGNVGRGILELHGRMNWDFLLSKYFHMPWEGHRLQFRFEAFNFLNTAHLGAPGSANPVTRIDPTRTTGATIYRADDPRIIQVALKYQF